MSVPQDTEGKLNFCLQFLHQMQNNFGALSARLDRVETQMSTYKGVEASLPQSVRELKRELEFLKNAVGASAEYTPSTVKTPETVVQTNPKLFEQMKGSIEQLPR